MTTVSSRLTRPFGFAIVILVNIFLIQSTQATATITGSGDVITGNSYTGSSGIERDYIVYVPQSYDGSSPVAMIMALHGCVMDNYDALNAWNLDIIADAHNVILVLPYVGQFTELRSDDCWGYWFDTHVQESKGGEVDDLYQIAREVEASYLIDEDRRFITGLSSGAAMAVAEAVAYNEYWAAAAPVAGLPYGDWSVSVTADLFQSLSTHIDKLEAELDYDRAVPMLVVQSANDTTVMPTAMELIRDSQLSVWGGDLTADNSESCSKGGVSCTLTTYNSEDGTPLIKTMYYQGGPGRSASYGQGHYWTGGDDDLDVWSDDSNGPNATEQLWAFFTEVTDGNFNPACDSDTTAPAIPTGLAAVDVHDDYARFTVNANGETDLSGYKIYRVGGAELTPAVSASTTITVSGLTASTGYDVYATAVDQCGNESAASTAISFSTTAPEYIAPSATSTCTTHFISGRLDVNGYLNCGTEHGYLTDVTLWQLETGEWTDTNPNGDEPQEPQDPQNPVDPGSWSTDPSLAGMEVHIYSPNSVTANGQRALMIALHGCAQSNEVVRDSWGWEDQADQHGMVIATPMAPNGGVIFGCWDYYGNTHSAANPGRHDDNLIDLANSLMANISLNIDPNQVYISGLSSGGGQTFVMGCLRPDIFAGIGINAGPALGTSSGQIGSVPFGTSASSIANICTGFSNSDNDFNTQLVSVVHGLSDTTVAQGYADLNADAMAIVFGANKDSNTKSISGGGTEQTWSDNQGVRVSQIMVSGLGHAWPAGSNSSGGGYTDHTTIDYPAFVTAFFFDNNRRADFVSTTSPTTTPTPLPPTTTPSLCDEVATLNYYHETAGRAASSNSIWTTDYYATGSNESISGSTWSSTTLHSFDGIVWHVGDCPG